MGRLLSQGKNSCLAGPSCPRIGFLTIAVASRPRGCLLSVMLEGMLVYSKPGQLTAACRGRWRNTCPSFSQLVSQPVSQAFSQSVSHTSVSGNGHLVAEACHACACAPGSRRGRWRRWWLQPLAAGPSWCGCCPPPWPPAAPWPPGPPHLAITTSWSGLRYVPLRQRVLRPKSPICLQMSRRCSAPGVPLPAGGPAAGVPKASSSQELRASRFAANCIVSR